MANPVSKYKEGEVCVAARRAALLLFAIVLGGTTLQQPAADGRRLPPSPMQLLQQADDHYRAQEWALAVEKYEAALARQPDLVRVFFFLGNSYERWYDQSRPGEPVNDARLQKAIEYYRLASERDSEPRMRTLAQEYLRAAERPAR